jgi:hypothetical protein
MRLIQQRRDNPNILEVAWMWLPTFIGQNTALLGELDHVLNAHYIKPMSGNLVVDDHVLDEINDFTINWIVGKLNISGLEEYLRAVKHIGV